MQKHFFEYLKNPELFDKECINTLEELLNKYPFFQTARILYVKNLRKANNQSYNKQLKLSTIFLSDLKKLHSNVNNKKTIDENIKTEIVEKKEELDKKNIAKNNAKSQTKEIINSNQKIEKEKKEKTYTTRGIRNNGKEKSKKIIEKDKSKKTEKLYTNKKSLEKHDVIIDVLFNKKEVKEKNNGKTKQVESINKPIEKNENKEEDKLHSDLSKNIYNKISKLKNNGGLKFNKKIEAERIEKEKQLALQKEKQKKERKEKQLIEKEKIEIERIENEKQLALQKENKKKLSAANKILERISKRKQSSENTEDKQSSKNKLTEIKVNKKNNNKTKLIDKFIQNKPRIKIKNDKIDSNNNELANLTNIDNTNEDIFITESLAELYVKQKYFDKAIDIFNKLILKFPKKKTYFANRIKEIKN